MCEPLCCDGLTSTGLISRSLGGGMLSLQDDPVSDFLKEQWTHCSGVLREAVEGKVDLPTH